MATTERLQPRDIAVTHELRRAHDGTVISRHCSLACGQYALEAVTLAQMMGETPPGPLEWVEARLVDVATGDTAMFTRGLVPLEGQPPAEVLDYR